ncbi:CBS domain-containing protein [Anaerocolumna sp.]|uniref:CBS domain-containing protein n=1 Tax=Anaerocolumna sp. TaxID=2041569 RepID=UPI0028A5FAA2|nr:CBS domain-containing protein [Anaerocolumna sp.]
MNIAYFLITKSEVAYLYNDCTLRQGLEKLHQHGYAAIPVLSKGNKYIGTVSEGDFLWHILEQDNQDLQTTTCMKRLENIKIKDILKPDKNPPVRITARMEELMIRAMDQNFVPVIDDRNYFIGIVTRRDIMKYFCEKSEVGAKLSFSESI